MHVFINHIVKVEIFEKEVAHQYRMEVERRRVNSIFQKAIYKEETYIDYWPGGHRYTPDEFAKAKPNFFVEGKQVFYKPHLHLSLSDGSTLNAFFQTLEEAEAQLKILLEANPAIHIGRQKSAPL